MIPVKDDAERRSTSSDRRRFPRGGRRESDLTGRTPLVIIVEGYDGVRHPCARYLNHFRFCVAEAATPAAAGVVLEQADPAAILIEDLNSPSFEELHDVARARAIPVISLSTALRDAALERAAAVGATGVLLKPFSLSAMLEEIRRVLRQQVQVAP